MLLEPKGAKKVKVREAKSESRVRIARGGCSKAKGTNHSKPERDSKDAFVDQFLRNTDQREKREFS